MSQILMSNLNILLQIILLIVVYFISKKLNIPVDQKVYNDLIDKIHDNNMKVGDEYKDSDGATKLKISTDMLVNQISKKERNILEKIHGSLSKAVDFVYKNRTLFFKIKDLLKK